MDIFDCNNYVRVKFEKDPTGLPLRLLFSEAYSNPPSLYVFDGFKSKALRQAKFPDYKGGRKPAPDNFYHILNFFEELLQHTGNVIIKVPGYEADDVIATYCKANPQMPLRVMSTDGDYTALIRPGLETPMANLKGNLPEDIPLFKTLVGDTSDNIKGIPGFGKKTFEALSSDQKKLWESFLRREVTPTDFGELGVKGRAQASWVSEPEHQELLRIYWEIIGFYTVPPELLAQHIRVGTKNFALADQKMKESLM